MDRIGVGDDPIRLLLIEDNRGDAVLIREYLAEVEGGVGLYTMTKASDH